VVADIDGTITRTDLGGICGYWLNRKCFQPHVADLFHAIHTQGYQMLYLSARPIGTHRAAIGILTWPTEQDKTLPIGPVLHSPDNLWPVAKRELKGQQYRFKAAALQEISSLFAANPIKAGFGNRDVDGISYLSAGVPLEAVWIVNPYGQVHHFESDNRYEGCSNVTSYEEIMR
jgi:phosphatidate phosphatase LPIN